MEEVDEVIARLQTSPSPEGLEENMHFLKGSPLNLGFSLMGQICQDSEKLASEGKHDEIDVRKLFAAYEASKKEFLSDDEKYAA